MARAGQMLGKKEANVVVREGNRNESERVARVQARREWMGGTPICRCLFSFDRLHAQLLLHTEVRWTRYRSDTRPF